MLSEQNFHVISNYEKLLVNLAGTGIKPSITYQVTIRFSHKF